MRDRQKILIVDDKKENLYALDKILGETEAEIINASSGNDALIASLNHEFALAILDVQMPEMNGYELAEHLRGEEKTRDLPIIFLSAVYSDDYHVFRGYEAGGFDFITKPYNPGILISKVNVFLQLDSQRTELLEKIELERSKNYLENILESVTDLVMVVSKEGTIRTANRAATQLLGYSVEEINGMSLDSIFEDEEFKSWILSLDDKAVPNAHTRRPLLSKEKTLRTRKGIKVPAIVSGSAFGDNAGLVLGAVLAAMDITERKQAEDSLRRMSRVFMDSADPIIIEDLDGMIIDLNDEAENIYGWNREELLGNPLKTVVPPDRHDQADELLERCKRGEAVRNKEGLRWTKTGNIVPVLITLSPLTDGADKLVAIATIAKDISRLKTVQDMLKRKTAALERSNKELEQFAYVASHDLQEPLRKVQAFGDRLRKRCADVVDDQALDYLDRMQGATRRMRSMIDDLLSLSRIHTRSAPFAPVDLTQAAHEVVKDLDMLIDQTGGRVEIGDLPTIEADLPQIRQLLGNLIGNALKFRNKDVAPVVKIDSKPIRKRTGVIGAAQCQVIVADNGIGFEEKFAERIFQPFERLHSQGKYEGTGIGLSICKKIVERHGGSIIAQGEPGRGAKFIVTLPVSE